MSADGIPCVGELLGRYFVQRIEVSYVFAFAQYTNTQVLVNSGLDFYTQKKVRAKTALRSRKVSSHPHTDYNKFVESGRCDRESRISGYAYSPLKSGCEWTYITDTRSPLVYRSV